MNEKNQDLNSPEQLAIREVVKALPDETLSLAWRSELNTKIHAAIVRRKKLDLFGWIWKPAAGIAVASAFAVMFLAKAPLVAPVARSSGDLERALVNAHIETSVSWDVAEGGVTAGEAKENAGVPVPNEWEQEDVGATL
jgi:hypothetical protein